jgi:hypothetical protein
MKDTMDTKRSPAATQDRTAKGERAQDRPRKEAKPGSEVRPEEVARAKELIKDDDYPSDQIIQRIADVLATRLEKEEEPGEH